MSMFYFNGTTADIITVPYDVRHALTGNMEIETVFRMSSTNPIGTIISFSGYDNGGNELEANNTLFSLYLSSVRRLSVLHEYGLGSEFQANGTTDLPEGWIRVRMVRSNLTYSVYVNGNLYLQASYLSNQTPSFGTNVGPESSIRVGAAYFNLTARNTLARVTIAYVKVKNGSGQIVYELGEDPGGAPAANAPFMGASILDIYGKNMERPAQTKSGKEGFDPYAGVLQRPSQRGTGYILDMSGTSGGGESEPIQTPRAYPLETSWKKANPSQFS